MKKILFIHSIFDTGGVSKSLLNLLYAMDKTRFQIDLLVMNPSGELQKLIPPGVNMLDSSGFEIFFGSYMRCARALLKRGRVIACMIRLLSSIVSKFDPPSGALLLKMLLPKLTKQYDVAVDYGGQTQLYYLIDKIDAHKKLTFFHNDYAKWKYFEREDRKYYHFADAIFTVSSICVDAMKRIFPEYADKIFLSENISIPNLLENLSREPVTDSLSKKEFSILTLGHLCERKGTDLAIRAAHILKMSECRFKWYFLGKNQGGGKYEALVKSLKLSNDIVFMGSKSNPYPYIRDTRLFVLPSKHEGKSIALDEAKIFCKPIVVTNFSTVHDQFEDRVNASICEMSPESLASSIAELIKDSALRERYSRNLEQENEKSRGITSPFINFLERELQ